MAIPIPIILGIICEAASAAGGIAGAAGQKAQSDAAAANSDSDRRLQEKLIRMQLAQQKQQFDQNNLMQAQQALASTYQQKADLGLNRAADRQQARARLLQSLSRIAE